MTIAEINSLISWVSNNQEHLQGHGAKLLIALAEAREYQARRITGQPASYQIGPGPHGGAFACKEH